MTKPKYTIGQRIYFEYEFMQAVLLPSGHSEQWETYDTDGVIRDMYDHERRWYYTVVAEIDGISVECDVHEADVECGDFEDTEFQSIITPLFAI